MSFSFRHKDRQYYYKEAEEKQQLSAKAIVLAPPSWQRLVDVISGLLVFTSIAFNWKPLPGILRAGKKAIQQYQNEPTNTFGGGQIANALAHSINGEFHYHPG